MPTARLDPRFSSSGAGPLAWEPVQHVLTEADPYWVVTVRPDGRPHVTPLFAVVLDDVLRFRTGPTEQKVKNLAVHPHCSLLTGNSTRMEGPDLVVEGTAVRVTDEGLLRRLADEWVRRYGEDWQFEVVDGSFVHADDSLRADPGGAHASLSPPTASSASARASPTARPVSRSPSSDGGAGNPPERGELE
jgi:hypothetical protein